MRKQPIKLFALISFSLMGEVALAIPRVALHPGGNIPCNRNPPYTAFNSLVQKVSIVDKEDRRLSKDYADDHHLKVEDVEKRFGATGTIHCDYPPGVPGKGETGSADVVLKNNILTTSAHIFFDEKCNQISDPNKCTFTTVINGVPMVSNIKSVSDMGFKCDPKADYSESKILKDWAVLILDPPLEGVTPYNVRETEQEPPGDDFAAVAVNGQNQDFLDAKGNKILGRTIADCTIKKRYGHKPAGITSFGTNCDGSFGSSGSALLDNSPSDRPTLLGIRTGDKTTLEDENAAIKSGVIQPQDFVSKKWLSYYTPVKGEYFNAIHKAAGAD